MKHISRGFFITFEGIEGSGKSTQMSLLAEYLRGRGYEIVVTREPGGTSIGDSIRNILLDPRFSSMDSRTELFLYAASRAQLVYEIIRPALAAGKVVLCDRFADSSLTYQGFGRGIPLDEIEMLNRWATSALSPQLTIILWILAQDGLARATRDSADRIERESIDFHQRVRDGYRNLARQYPERIRLVDASGSPQDIHLRIVQLVADFLKKEETN